MRSTLTRPSPKAAPAFAVGMLVEKREKPGLVALILHLDYAGIPAKSPQFPPRWQPVFNALYVSVPEGEPLPKPGTTEVDVPLEGWTCFVGTITLENEDI